MGRPPEPGPTILALFGADNPILAVVFALRLFERTQGVLTLVPMGDQVEGSYYESLVWNVKKATGGNPGVSTMTVTIDSVDLDNGTVTLEGPRHQPISSAELICIFRIFC